MCVRVGGDSIERLELFDEFEEWFLFHSHYCIVVAATLPALVAPFLALSTARKAASVAPDSKGATPTLPPQHAHTSAPAEQPHAHARPPS